MASGFEAVHLRHLHVHQHDVVALALQGAQHFKAVGDGVRPVPEPVQDPDCKLLIYHVILSEKDAQRQVRRQSFRECGFVVFLCSLGRRAKYACERVKELRSSERLWQERYVAKLRRVDLLTEGGGEHDGQFGRLGARPQLFGECDAVHSRHLDVQDRHVEGVAFVDPRKGFKGRFGVSHAHAPAGRELGDDAPVCRRVVDEEHAAIA